MWETGFSKFSINESFQEIVLTVGNYFDELDRYLETKPFLSKFDYLIPRPSNGYHTNPGQTLKNCDKTLPSESPQL
jgi:hypothetical protein